jgi:transcription initiation factor IIE alpha subunit
MGKPLVFPSVRPGCVEAALEIIKKGETTDTRLSQITGFKTQSIRNALRPLVEIGKLLMVIRNPYGRNNGTEYVYRLAVGAVSTKPKLGKKGQPLTPPPYRAGYRWGDRL